MLLDAVKMPRLEMLLPDFNVAAVPSIRSCNSTASEGSVRTERDNHAVPIIHAPAAARWRGLTTGSMSPLIIGTGSEFLEAVKQLVPQLPRPPSVMRAKTLPFIVETPAPVTGESTDDLQRKLSKCKLALLPLARNAAAGVAASTATAARDNTGYVFVIPLPERCVAPDVHALVHHAPHPRRLNSHAPLAY